MPRRGRLDDELRGEIDLSLRRERLFAQLATLLGGVTLLLATVGLYGLLAYSVTRRMPELGLRMALGASRGTVRWMVMKQSLVLVGAGLVIGIPAAGVMLAVSLLAAFVPARRASRVDPAIALRAE